MLLYVFFFCQSESIPERYLNSFSTALIINLSFDMGSFSRSLHSPPSLHSTVSSPNTRAYLNKPRESRTFAMLTNSQWERKNSYKHTQSHTHKSLFLTHTLTFKCKCATHTQLNFYSFFFNPFPDFIFDWQPFFLPPLLPGLLQICCQLRLTFLASIVCTNIMDFHVLSLLSLWIVGDRGKAKG